MTLSHLTRMARAAAPVAVVAGLLAAAPVQAQAARDTQAEAFVNTNGQRVLSVLNGRVAGEARRQAFHGLISELVDWPKLTRFVLGKYARTATPDQLARFTAAYRTYAEGVFQHRIEDYKGEHAVVTGSVIRRPGDVIVKSNLTSAANPQPTELSWRVLGAGNQWKVVDVQVKGVWLAITEQQDFVSTIDNAGGNVDVLIKQLQSGGQKR